MAQIREIKRRLKTVKNIQKITQAMKVVASARLKKAQERILGARPYAYGLAEVIRNLSGSVERQLHPLLAKHEKGKIALFVITADRGLCGSFNSNILRRAQAYLKENPGTTLITVGKKSRDFFTRRNVPLHRDWTHVFPAVAFQNVKEMADTVTQLYTGEPYQRVDVLYNEFKSVIQQKVTIDTILPIEPEKLPGDGKARPAGVDMMFEPGVDAILDTLMPLYVAIEIQRMLLESFSSEMGARRMAMESATKNANEMIAKLTLAYNRLRQAGITKEIAEIVGGAEALK
jgi:F-type H+-transporting ATPase subunit gamma